MADQFALSVRNPVRCLILTRSVQSVILMAFLSVKLYEGKGDLKTKSILALPTEWIKRGIDGAKLFLDFSVDLSL